MLNINEIVEEWKNDSPIDSSRLEYELCRTPSLHSKYVNYYILFKQELGKAEYNYSKLANIKRRYYRGEMTYDDLQKYEWSQYQGLKPNLSEMNSLLEYDIDLSKLKEKVNELKSAVQAMEYIIKSITGRDYSLKSLIDYQKFLNGG